MTSFISFNISKLVALILGSSTLTISVQNPIHSILMLIVSFAFGSCMLISFALEYYAVLFFTVYVGAIVVLFLFIIMMLDLKMLNFSTDIFNLLSSRNLWLSFLVFQIIGLQYFADMLNLNLMSFISDWNPFIETNCAAKIAENFNYDWTLTSLGAELFRIFAFEIILSALLLFVSMVGSIALTLDTLTISNVKVQDGNFQSLRTPALIHSSGFWGWFLAFGLAYVFCDYYFWS